MAYTKQTWSDLTSVVNASELNHMEDGIETADAKVDALAAGMDDRMANFMAAQGYAVTKTFAFGTTPAVTPNTVWYELASGTPAAASATLICHQGDTTDQATYNFTPENTMSAAALYIAFVWGGMLGSGTTAASLPSSMTGRSVTWTKVGAGITSANTFTSLQIFKGIGTPSASGALSVTFPSAQQGCHIEVLGVQSVSTIVADSAYNAPSTSLTAPVVTLTTAPASTKFQLYALAVQNTTSTVTTDPGTAFGTAPDVDTSTPSLQSRASYRTAAQTTGTWAQSAAAQYAAATVVLTPA